jgi:uncharacterized damage-inducible protein DinB
MMKRMCCISLFVFSTLFLTIPLTAAGPELSPVAKVIDGEIGMLESEFVPLAEAMPVEKFSFVPTGGEFKGVRTFGQQVSHTAAVIYTLASRLIGEPSPSDPGKDENGPATLKTKDDILKYLKEAFAYAHRAMTKLNETNLTQSVSVPWGKPTKLFLADLIVWHSFDHYGQMVVYARMNGIIPPASRPKK